MKESVEMFLKGIGVDADTINAFKADELPEGFDMQATAKGYISKRKELLLNDSDLQKELKSKFNSELYPAIVKPLLTELKRTTGLSSEQLKSITSEGQSLPDMKKAIALGIETFSKTSASGVDEVKKELFEWKSKHESALSTWQQEKEAMQNGFIQAQKREKVNRHFEKAVSSLETIIPSEAANIALSSSLMKTYNFDVTDDGNLVVLTKDGGKVDDGNNFLSAQDVIKREAERFEILRKSNGGSGNTPPAGGGKTPKFTPNTKVSPSVQRMIDAANRKR